MHVKLVVTEGKTATREILLSTPRTVIGRRSECDVQITSPMVSRKHCALVDREGTLMVQDLGSSNGTFVNGNRIEEQALQPGDQLVVGPVSFVVEYTPQSGSLAPDATLRVSEVGAVPASGGGDTEADATGGSWVEVLDLDEKTPQGGPAPASAESEDARMSAEEVEDAALAEFLLQVDEEEGQASK